MKDTLLNSKYVSSKQVYDVSLKIRLMVEDEQDAQDWKTHFVWLLRQHMKTTSDSRRALKRISGNIKFFTRSPLK